MCVILFERVMKMGDERLSSLTRELLETALDESVVILRDCASSLMICLRYHLKNIIFMDTYILSKGKNSLSIVNSYVYIVNLGSEDQHFLILSCLEPPRSSFLDLGLIPGQCKKYEYPVLLP